MFSTNSFTFIYYLYTDNTDIDRRVSDVICLKCKL